MLMLLAGGGAHGYAITSQLEELGITGGSVDVGQVYRTLRDLEAAGHVTSAWSNEPAGPQRRDYELTESGYATLDEWAAVMTERGRLVAEFDARYLEWVATATAATFPGGGHRHVTARSPQSGSATACSMDRASSSLPGSSMAPSRTPRYSSSSARCTFRMVNSR